MRTIFLCVVSLLILLIKSSDGQFESDVDGDEYPRDCSDHLLNGNYKSEEYTIKLNSKFFNVFCDMDTDGGGWTVIQRRGKFFGHPQENFYRDWEDYKNGFGNINRDFWLGNENIHILSNLAPVEIRFDLEDAKGNKRYAFYKNFYLEGENKDYTLHISGYSGDAGDGMKFHDGKKFSSRNRGNHQAVIANHGPWWITDWPYVHLNGLYEPGVYLLQAFHWYKWLENEGLARSEIKIRQH